MQREIAPVLSFFSWPVLGFLAIMAIIILVAWKTWKKEPLVAFGFAWFFILLLPRANILKINLPMYEHWLYLPLVGFWLAIFSLFLSLRAKRSNHADSGENGISSPASVSLQRDGSSRGGTLRNDNSLALLRVFFCVMIIAYCVFLGTLTVLRNRDWRDPITFYEKNLRDTPNNFIEHNNLGMAYADAGRNEEAIAQYRQAIAIKDVYVQVHYNLANSLVNLKQYDEAEKEYQRAIAMDPGFILPYRNLYDLYVYLGDKEKASEVLKKISNLK
jgi:protein O-mannosyl-transferase